MQMTGSKRNDIYLMLKKRITDGGYPPSFRFPSEPELSRELGVGRVTLRGALEMLEKTGHIVRFPGKGTFVSGEDSRKTGLKKFLFINLSPLSSLEAPTNYLTPEMIRVCVKKDIDFDILAVDFMRSLPTQRAVDQLSEQQYDGVLLGGCSYIGNEKEITVLRQLQLPVLIVHAKPGDGAVTGFASMYADYKQAWRDAVAYLVSCGHENIITLGAITSTSSRYLREFEEKEYLDFLASLGANPDPALLEFIGFNYSGLTKQLAGKLAMSPRPSAILCFSDFFAMNVYDSLNSLGIGIPDDVAVMGYCGYPGGHMMAPPLTTIDFDYADIGRQAVELLDRASEWFNPGSDSRLSIISPHRLLIRESTR